MAFIVKDENGNIVLNIRFSDIPYFLEENPECEYARLMRQTYENEESRTPPHHDPESPSDDSGLNVFIRLKHNLDYEFWRNQENIDFIRNQGIVNVNKYKDLPKDYYGLACVPITSPGLFNDPWSTEFEVVEQTANTGKVVIDGKQKYERVIVRRRCLEGIPSLFDIKGHEKLERPDNAEILLKKILKIRAKKPNC